MIDLNQHIYDIDGEISKSKVKVYDKVDQDGEIVEVPRMTMKDVTLGSMLRHSVLKSNGDTEEKSVLNRYELFKKLNLPEKDEAIVELNEEEKELLSKLVCQSLEIFYAGSIIQILNK